MHIYIYVVLNSHSMCINSHKHVLGNCHIFVYTCKQQKAVDSWRSPAPRHLVAGHWDSPQQLHPFWPRLMLKSSACWAWFLAPIVNNTSTWIDCIHTYIFGELGLNWLNTHVWSCLYWFLNSGLIGTKKYRPLQTPAPTWDEFKGPHFFSYNTATLNHDASDAQLGRLQFQGSMF